MSFEDFMAGFKEKHPAWFAGNPGNTQNNIESRRIIPKLADLGGSVAVKAPMVKEAVKAPEIKPPVAKEVVVEDDWDAAEVVEVEESSNWWDK